MEGPQPKFELQKAADNQWYFTLKAANGKVIAVSELYRNRKGAERGIDAVRHAAPAARTVVLT